MNGRVVVLREFCARLTDSIRLTVGSAEQLQGDACWLDRGDRRVVSRVRTEEIDPETPFDPANSLDWLVLPNVLTLVSRNGKGRMNGKGIVLYDASYHLLSRLRESKFYYSLGRAMSLYVRSGIHAPLLMLRPPREETSGQAGRADSTIQLKKEEKRRRERTRRAPRFCSLPLSFDHLLVFFVASIL